MPDSKDLFNRNVPGMTEALMTAHVGIAGCGGLGSNTAVALTRAGIGQLTLADFDRVELSNLNRQHFFLKDIDSYKTTALANHLKAIRPQLKLNLHTCKVTRENLTRIFSQVDLLIEAFDQADDKLELIESWVKIFPGKAIIVGNGIGGLGKSNDLKVTQTGRIFFCGDLTSDMSLGLCAARVGIVANMQANVAIEELLKRGFHDNREQQR
jgi:sulfur carrier protein ThiS adenylyltransferase